MFLKHLNELFQILDANNGEIARFAGFDRTNISHMRSGSRTPLSSGKAVQKLVNGIWLYAKENQKIPLLCSAVGCSPELSEDEIRQALLSWLFESELSAGDRNNKGGSAKNRKPRKPTFRSFGERLNLSMELADLSNVQLSRLIHTDPSQISRYRNGIRTPAANPNLSEKLSLTLYERILKNGRKEDLSNIMTFPSDELDADDFSAWLFEQKQQQEESIQAAEEFFGIFNSFTGESHIPLPDPESAVTEDLLKDTRAVYFGTEGLRDAVLRFLGTAYRDKAKLLLLYSDESQNWMTGDPVYLARWASLMSACVKNGTQIRIVHNIDRDLTEMNEAIRSWLPLYMSGMIESYYSKRRRNFRFSHTIFLNPGNACIEAFHATGHESDSHYHYETDPRVLSACEAKYDNFLANCHPLFIPRLQTQTELHSNIYLIQNTLPIATMPEELAERFSSETFLTEWRQRQEEFLKHLASGSFNLYVPKDPFRNSSDGQIPVEQISGAEPLFYTPDQYFLHLENTRKLSKEYSSFHLYLIKEAPFPNMSIQISEDSAIIRHTVNPSLSFGFSHPLMCQAFMDYARGLKSE